MTQPVHARNILTFASLALLLAGLFAVATATANEFADEPAVGAPPPSEQGFKRWHGYSQEVHTTESGLQYKVIKMGTGPKPESRKSKVTVLYRGFLEDGRQFDTTYEWGEPLVIQLRKTVEGWEEGIQLMPVDSKFVFLIPPELGYGKRGRGPIPGNAWMMFEIHLLDVKN
ncbi:FKBP-type peptidyl-prolyl cis-trans isomerase [Marinihelvus fidelis]|nr:FKBP-type peptidyl-prolyl cis-trans isomerase [Marinihelvus fidelis]